MKFRATLINFVLDSDVETSADGFTCVFSGGAPRPLTHHTGPSQV